MGIRQQSPVFHEQHQLSWYPVNFHLLQQYVRRKQSSVKELMTHRFNGQNLDLPWIEFGTYDVKLDTVRSNEKAYSVVERRCPLNRITSNFANRVDGPSALRTRATRSVRAAVWILTVDQVVCVNNYQLMFAA